MADEAAHAVAVDTVHAAAAGQALAVLARRLHLPQG